MTRRSLRFTVALALLLVASACSGDGAGEEAAPTLSPAPEVSNPLGECARNTRIGVVYDERSQTAFREGLSLAADQLNQRGSFNYEPALVVVGGVETAGVAEPTEELASREDISVILSTARDAGAEASVDAARAGDVAILLVGASSDDVGLGNGAFSLRLSAPGEVDALKEVATNELGFKDVKVVGFPGLVDSGGDYIVAPAPGQDPGPLMKGVTEIVGPDSVVGTSQYVFTDAGDIPDGVHVGVPWYVDAPVVESEDFGASFEQAYGTKPTIDAAYGYTSVFLIARAVESACSNERADIIEELGKTKDAASVFGPFSLNKKGEPSHPMYLLKIRNGTPTKP